MFRLRLAALTIFPISALAGTPGFIMVVGEDPVPLQISPAASRPYKLTYNAARISVWDTAIRDNLISPGQVLTAPPAPGDADGDGDFDLGDFAALQRCFTGDGGGPVSPECAMFDTEGDGDVDLTDFGVSQPSFTGPFAPLLGDLDASGRVDLNDFTAWFACLSGPFIFGCTEADLDDDGDTDLADFGIFQSVFGNAPPMPDVSVTVYVEGLTPSTALGDTTVDLLTDPDGDGTFDVSETQAVTVASIDISPTSGPPGTPLTVTMQPAIAPLAFDSTTTADWQGVYQPPVGPATAPFQIAYDAGQFRESSAGQAILIVGDGTITNAPDFESLDGPGTTPGMFTFNLAGLTLSRSFAFAPESSAAVWEQIDYPDGPGGMGTPVLDGEPNELPVMLLSGTPDPLNPSEDLLLHANSFHIAAVVRIDENPETTADAPATLLVNLISYDAAEVEIDRVENVQLDKVAGDDGDPDRIVYHNDLEVPIVLVDVDLNEGAYRAW